MKDQLQFVATTSAFDKFAQNFYPVEIFKNQKVNYIDSGLAYYFYSTICHCLKCTTSSIADFEEAMEQRCFIKVKRKNGFSYKYYKTAENES